MSAPANRDVVVGRHIRLVEATRGLRLLPHEERVLQWMAAHAPAGAVDDLAALLTHAVAADPAPQHPVPASRKRGDCGLTERHRQILALLAQGKTYSEIGRHLGLREETVKTHSQKLFRKLGARTQAQAVALGYQLRLLGGASCAR